MCILSVVVNPVHSDFSPWLVLGSRTRKPSGKGKIYNPAKSAALIAREEATATAANAKFARRRRASVPSLTHRTMMLFGTGASSAPAEFQFLPGKVWHGH